MSIMSFSPFLKYLLLFCFITLPFSSFSNAPLNHFDRFSVDDGLSQSSVTCAVEDDLGFTWLGSQSGLNKLDGYSAETFKETKKPGYLTGSWVTACVKDQFGRLWFSTASKGINRFDPQTGLFESNTWSSELQDKRVLSMLMTNTGELLLGTASGSLNIINLSDNSIRVATQPERPIQGIRALYQKPQSNHFYWNQNIRSLISLVFGRLSKIKKIYYG